MSPVKPYHRYRGLRDFTMPSLLEAACDLLPRIVPRQTRYKVTDLPTERTVRYYISRGIVDRPTGRRGTSALFGYRHLLQILTVKQLQSRYLPLRRIRILLRDRTNRELERLLEGAEADASAAPLRSPPHEVRRVRAQGGEGWHRYVLAPGIELHLRDDHPAPPGEEDRGRLRARLLAALEELWAERH